MVSNAVTCVCLSTCSSPRGRKCFANEIVVTLLATVTVLARY